MKNCAFILVLVVVTFVSCKQPIVSFADPQPIDVRNLNRIPRKIIGEYYNANDTVSLFVNRNSIFKAWNYIDSLNRPAVYIDTIFSFSRKDILKKYKGYYFLSHEFHPENWEVKKLKLKNGALVISEISSDNEIENLQNITETKVDSTKPFKVKPSKKQFKDFLKANGFAEAETFVRVN